MSVAATTRHRSGSGTCPVVSRTFLRRLGSPSFGTPSPEDASTPNSDRPGAPDPSMRYLRRVDARPNASVFDTGKAPVPFMPPTQSPLAPAPPTSFDDRFGNWGASAPASATAGAPQPMGSPQPGGTKRLDPKDIRILARVSPSGDTIFPPTSTPNTQAPPQRLDQWASSAASRCRDIPFHRCSLAFRIALPPPATTWTTGSPAGSSR
jgi:hypothetical protein